MHETESFILQTQDLINNQLIKCKKLIKLLRFVFCCEPCLRKPWKLHTRVHGYFRNLCLLAPTFVCMIIVAVTISIGFIWWSIARPIINLKSYHRLFSWRYHWQLNLIYRWWTMKYTFHSQGNKKCFLTPRQFLLI